MRNLTKWTWLIAAAGVLPLWGWSCSTTFRDAVLAGVLDFVSGTTSAVLSSLIPVTDALASG